MFYAYRIVSWMYLLVPVLACAGAIFRARRLRRVRPVRRFLRACTTGAFLGGTTAVIHASFNGTVARPGQVAMACYAGVAAVCIVIVLNWVCGEAAARLMRIDPTTGGGCCRGAQVAAILLQALLLLAIGLPYLGSLAALYRLKSHSPGDPGTLLGASFDRVQFSATDGTSIDGWWIPAARGARTDGRGSVKWGRDTVVFCHGFGADKAGQLFLVRDLVANGYNVLAIDLRAHGRSGGQLTGMGALESRDVLGAVRWVRGNHAGGSHRILGLGESLGAVALICAAADPGPDGQAIDAVAAYNPYDRFAVIAENVLQAHTVAPGRWMVTHLALPLASVQIGVDLSTFSPARAAQAVWPRPLLVVGNPSARRFGCERSYELYRDAMQPKFGYFRDDEDPDALLHDPDAALTVRIFFDGERSIL